MKDKSILYEVSKLKSYAKKNGLDIKFVNYRTATGDFHIFIYDKAVKSSYMVGLDGYWDTSYEPLSFKAGINAAYTWINLRDFRYKKVNGQWKYVG